METLSEDDRAKMSAARVLIKEKRYALAREVLQGVNHPKATDWILKIDSLAPPKKPAPKRRAVLWAIVLVLIVGITLWYIQARQNVIFESNLILQTLDQQGNSMRTAGFATLRAQETQPTQR